MLLATAAGMVLKDDLSLLIIPAAIVCYAWVWWHRARATLADDYVLLLGAMLVSAEVLMRWPRQFLPLAIVHGVGAYAYKSRLLLSLSISALAAWMGVERRTAFDFSADLAPRAFLTAGLVIAWRQLHDRLSNIRDFLRVCEHFAANLALWGALSLASDPGYLLTIAVAALVMAWGFKQRSEPFVLYAFVYAVIGADALLLHHFEHEAAIILISSVIAIAALIAIDKRFRERRG